MTDKRKQSFEDQLYKHEEGPNGLAFKQIGKKDIRTGVNRNKI
jgi:hypothetical protein